MLSSRSKGWSVTGNWWKLATTTSTSSRCPLITTKSQAAMVLNSRADTVLCPLVVGSKKVAKFRPICRPMTSPANSIAVKTTLAAKPMVTPMKTCWTTIASAVGVSSGSTGIGGSTGWAHSAVSRARPMRARTGIARIDSTGAAANRPRMRSSGHSSGTIHCSSCASLKPITAGAPGPGLSRPSREWPAACAAGTRPAW